MIKKIISKLFDIIILLASLIIIGFLIWVTYASIVTWMPLFNNEIRVNGKGFWAGIILAILSGIVYFLEKWIRTFAKTFTSLIPPKKRLVLPIKKNE